MSKRHPIPIGATSMECPHCGITKPIELFETAKNTLSGYRARCLACGVKRDREYRSKNPERKRKQALGKRETYWSSSEKRKRGPRSHARDPVKDKARRALREAVRYGLIAKPSSCQDCSGEGQLHGHHTDYSKPFDVEWLCTACHGRRHRKYQEPLSTQKGDHPDAPDR